MTTNRLLKIWENAANDLEIEVIAPFILILSSDTRIKAEFLVKNFGATKGMVIFKQYDQIAPFVNEIVKKGYGFSVIDEPLKNEQYVRDDYIEMLTDWGWSGDKHKKPSWL